MTPPPSNHVHARWGREYPVYYHSYDGEPATTLLHEKEPSSHSRVNVLDTIHLIHTLGGFRNATCAEEYASRVTLIMLMDVFEMTKVPDHLNFIAEPQFVSGCVGLMATVHPSPFQFEYGYICFRILIIALNACMLKRADLLAETITRMSVAPTTQRFPIFWDGSALLVNQAEKADWLMASTMVQMFEISVLNRLLQLLNADRKLLFLTLKKTSPIGLSCLILVLFRRFVGTGAPYGYEESPDRFTSIIQPYSRIFWRYILLPPISDAEDAAITCLHNLSSSYARLNDDKPVDVEDARNILHEFNQRLRASEPLALCYGVTLIRFVAPLVTPGCENLVPTTVKLSIKLLWGLLLNDKENKEAVRWIIASFMFYLRDIFETLKPTHFTHQPWIWKIVDHVITDGLVDLALRAMLTAPCFSTEKKFNPQDHMLISATIEFMIALNKLAPHIEFPLRFYNSGSLGDWCKYYFYFRVYGLENTVLDLEKGGKLSPNWSCGEIVAGVMKVVIGDEWGEFLIETAGSCDNPRCPWPVNSRFFCAECIDLIYCSAECLTSDWMHAWGGPHKRVCEHHGFRDPDSRKRYHRIFNLTEDIPGGFRDRNAMADTVAECVRNKASAPKQSYHLGLAIDRSNSVSSFKLDFQDGFKEPIDP